MYIRNPQNPRQQLFRWLSIDRVCSAFCYVSKFENVLSTTTAEVPVNRELNQLKGHHTSVKINFVFKIVKITFD